MQAEFNFNLIDKVIGSSAGEAATGHFLICVGKEGITYALQARSGCDIMRYRAHHELIYVHSCVVTESYHNVQFTEDFPAEYY